MKKILLILLVLGVGFGVSAQHRFEDLATFANQSNLFYFITPHTTLFDGDFLGFLNAMTYADWDVQTDIMPRNPYPNASNQNAVYIMFTFRRNVPKDFSNK